MDKQKLEKAKFLNEQIIKKEHEYVIIKKSNSPIKAFTRILNEELTLQIKAHIMTELQGEIELLTKEFEEL